MLPPRSSKLYASEFNKLFLRAFFLEGLTLLSYKITRFIRILCPVLARDKYVQKCLRVDSLDLGVIRA